ncbi:MAG: hypothetical protein ACI4GC_06180 [Acutalibacteraceae bacterium]
MKKIKKLLCVTLAVMLCFSVTFTNSSAESGETGYTAVSPVTKAVYNMLDKVVNSLLSGIASAMPTPKAWNDTSSVEGFMKGNEQFLKSSAYGSVWSLGYDSRSILLPEDEIIGKMYVAGSIGTENKFATEIVDDLKVRTVAINDGSGRGTAVLCVVDSYGLALSDVREIRTRLADYCAEKNINSVTVSVLHQHSAIDTFGMNGNIWEMALLNPLKGAFGKDTKNGKNEKYMENLFSQCVASVKAAAENLTEGKLYSGTADASKYTTDKRQPYVLDSNFNRLRFVPFDGSKETWLVSSPIHCVGNGAAGTAVTGDYPYYAEKEIGDGANVLFYLGAELGTTQNRNAQTVYGYSETMTRLEQTAGFGKNIGIDLKAINNDKEVAPLLNVAYREITLNIDNPLLLIAGKAGMFENIVKKLDGKYKVISEIGYIEVGNTLSFAVIPGELAAELAYGGTLPASASWSGEEWEHPSLQEIVKSNDIDRELQIIGIANDQIGYIVPGNDYIPMLHENSNSIELVSLGKNTASDIVTEFGCLILEVK